MVSIDILHTVPFSSLLMTMILSNKTANKNMLEI